MVFTLFTPCLSHFYPNSSAILIWFPEFPLYSQYLHPDFLHSRHSHNDSPLFHPTSKCPKSHYICSKCWSFDLHLQWRVGGAFTGSLHWPCFPPQFPYSQPGSLYSYHHLLHFRQSFLRFPILTFTDGHRKWYFNEFNAFNQLEKQPPKRFAKKTVP